MPLLDWNPDMIRFMMDASERTEYYRVLTDLLRPWLQPDMALCDAGCGLGYLSLALAPYVREITAVDINPRPLEVLQTLAEERGVRNIRVLCGDVAKLTPENPYDAMVFCLYGSMEKVLQVTAAQTAGRVFAFKRNYRTHRFSAGEYPLEQEYLSGAELQLREAGISYSLQNVSPEFGQPFRCFEDVRRFYRLYARDRDENCFTDEFLRSRIRETGDPEFPFYLPQTRAMGLLTWENR